MRIIDGDRGHYLDGTELADFIAGRGGDDIIEGRGGDDVLRGGFGMDNVGGGDGNDTVSGNQGVDILGGGAGDDILWGGQGDDVLNGGTGVDLLYGGAGVDVLLDDDGGDHLFGGDGSDNLSTDGVTQFSDLHGEAGSDQLAAQVGSLDGGDGNDYLQAQLVGGGFVAMTGGAGTDRFYAYTAPDGVAAAAQIFDFHPGEDNLAVGDGEADFFGRLDVNHDEVLNPADIGTVATDGYSLDLRLNGGEDNVWIAGTQELHASDFLF